MKNSFIYTILLFLLLWGRYESSGQGCSEYKDNVRILVAYTPAVALQYANPLQSLIQPSIDGMNTAFKNSGVNHRVVLVRALQIDYTESNDLIQSRDDFWNGAGVFNVVKKLKYLYQADICVLFTSIGNCGGICVEVGATRDNAYCVVKAPFSVERFSLAHEIGHLYGCRHERALDNASTPYAYGHGYVLPNVDANGYKLHTIMAYGTAANNNILTSPIPYFSNPDSLYQGQALGTAAYENETRVLNEGYNRIKSPLLAEVINIDTSQVIKGNEMADVNAYTELNSNASYVVESGANVVFRCTYDPKQPALIKLGPGFKAKNGCNFRAYTCLFNSSYAMKTVNLTGENHEITKTSVSIYPNPFTSQITIRYELEIQTQVRLTILGINGRLVQQLLSGETQERGTHEVVFDGSSLPKGIYVYQLVTGSKTETGKIVKT
jgi:hypothetical protein